MRALVDDIAFDPLRLVLCEQGRNQARYRGDKVLVVRFPLGEAVERLSDAGREMFAAILADVAQTGDATGFQWWFDAGQPLLPQVADLLPEKVAWLIEHHLLDDLFESISVERARHGVVLGARDGRHFLVSSVDSVRLEDEEIVLSGSGMFRPTWVQ